MDIRARIKLERKEKSLDVIMSIGISLPDKLVPFPVWQKKDGPIPFVFSAKKPGNQCAWSCVWFCALGKVLPDDWATVENMGIREKQDKQE